MYLATTYSEMKRSGIELRREKNRYSAGGKMRGMAALRSITRGRLRVIFLLHVDRQYIS
jgi:hypothetical protein